jgi:TonB family protein
MHYGEKGKNGVVLIYTKAKNNSQPAELNVKPKWTDKNGNHVFYKVDEMPEFPGGEMALLKYITNQTKYPEIARENGIQGKVYVAFIITKEGKVTEPSISRGVDPALDKEALRVIGSLPDWKPGKQGGQAVNVWYTVPITFGLQNQNNTKGNAVGFDFGSFNDVDPTMPPLYVVDGIVKISLADLSPDSIESVSVLKDKSAIALYGEKGKNGVILISTKNKEKIESYKSFENDQVTGNINWINNKKFSSKELTNLLGIRKGNVYSKEYVEKRIYGEVSSLYLDNGYLFFNITIAERKKENGIVDLDLTVFEGTQWKIGKIEIAGNKTVSAKEYLNKIEIKSGDLFSRSKLIQSVRTLNELIKQNAEQVDVDVNPLLESQGNEFNVVNLTYKIKEK